MRHIPSPRKPCSGDASWSAGTARCGASLLHAGCLVLASLLTAGTLCADDDLPPILREVGIDQQLNQQVPLDLPFRDEAGRTIRLGDCFHDKPVVLVLAYLRCPMLCTQVLNGVLDSARAMTLDLGKDYEIVTVSFDSREQPALAAAKKANYIADYGRPGSHAEEGWRFLTGEQDSITKLTDAVGFHYRYDPQKDQFAHASGIVVLTPQGKVARYFFGIKYPPRDLRLSLVEASANRIGSPVDRVLLFCYHYDAATGKYTAMTMNLVRLGGAATLVVMGSLLGLAWFRERRKRPLSC